MKTTVELSINRIDREFEVVFSGSINKWDIDGLNFHRWGVDHLISGNEYEINEAILNYFIGEIDYKGEQQFELERGN
tara:strand:- start:2426 stop:2656 length:231 start_codon:yes stop_codon:yes gene_type:complete